MATIPDTVPANKTEFEVYMEKALWETVGKKEQYTPEEIEQAFAGSNFSDKPGYLPWAVCVFASEKDFNRHYASNPGWYCYQVMRREMANPVSRYPTAEQIRDDENAFQQNNVSFFIRVLKMLFRL